MTDLEIDKQARMKAAETLSCLLLTGEASKEDQEKYESIINSMNMADADLFFKKYDMYMSQGAERIGVRLRRQIIEETEKPLANILQCCLNASLCYIIGSEFINNSIEVVENLCRDTENKRIKDCIRIIKASMSSNDDIACEAVKKNIMPTVWHYINCMRHSYNGYSRILDDMQYAIKDEIEIPYSKLIKCCESLENEVTEAAFLLSTIAKLTGEDITRHYNKIRSEYDIETTIKNVGCYMIKVGHLMKLADNAKNIAIISSNYSVSKNVWSDIESKIINTYKDIYSDTGSIVIDSLAKGKIDYLGYFFGVLVLSKRHGCTITETVKNNCIYEYGSKGGYAQVMKDIKKLDELTWNIGDPYQIGDKLNELIDGGEKFPAIQKLINKTVIKKNENISK